MGAMASEEARARALIPMCPRIGILMKPNHHSFHVDFRSSSPLADRCCNVFAECATSAAGHTKVIFFSGLRKTSPVKVNVKVA